MSALEQLLVAWQAILYTVRELFRPPLWAPWLLLGAVELAVLAALWWFAHPLLSWLTAPLLVALAGPNVLHYPNIFLLMPGIFARADVVVGAILGSIVIGASTVLFAKWFTGAEPRPAEGLSVGFRRASALILANLPLNLIVNLLPFAVEQWLADRHSSAFVVRGVRAGMLGAALMLQAFFLYVSALVVLDDRSAWSAFAGLPEAARRGMWAAFVLSLIAFLPLLPLRLLANGSGALVDRGTPELVGWMMVGEILLTLVVSFVLTGSTTLVYQTVVAPRPRGSLG